MQQLDLFPAPEIRCHHCGAPAAYYCDFVLGFASDDGLISRDSEIVTCDRPLCAGCRQKQGVMFDVYGKGTVETVDYCRDHAKEEFLVESGYVPGKPKTAPLKVLLAQKRRLQIRCATNNTLPGSPPGNQVFPARKK